MGVLVLLNESSALAMSIADIGAEYRAADGFVISGRWMNETFLFGSELRALEIYPNMNKQIDPAAMAWFMRAIYVLLPQSMCVGDSEMFARKGLMLSSTHPAGY